MELDDSLLYLRDLHNPVEEITKAMDVYDILYFLNSYNDNDFLSRSDTPLLVKEIFKVINEGKYDAKRIVEYLREIAPDIVKYVLLSFSLEQGVEIEDGGFYIGSPSPEEVVEWFEEAGVNEVFHLFSRQAGETHAADTFFALLVQKAVKRVLDGPSGDRN